MSSQHFLDQENNTRDPNPWQALYLDQSTPLPDHVKRAWLSDSASTSRQYLLPFVRPLARLLIILIQVIKVLLPKKWAASKALHKLLVWGLKGFVSPEANWLILRHFHMGAQIIEFVARNVNVKTDLHTLRPMDIEALEDELFLKHDLNLFNFVIQLNQQLRSEQRKIEFIEQPDFSMITEPPLSLEDMPKRFANGIDLQTAIEIFTPVYQLFLSDNDFWRASNSLQLDETVAVYIATMLNTPHHLLLLNNKHPLVPLSTLRAGHRLVLHGLSTEMLHCVLSQLKVEQAAKHAVSNA
jgi:hypothetical protein